MKHRIFASLSLMLSFSLALLLVLGACSGDPTGSVSPIQPPDSAGAPGGSGGDQSNASGGSTHATPPSGISDTPAPGSTPPQSQAPAQSSDTPSAQPSQEPAASPSASVPADPMRAAYRAALETIYNDHRYPNGDEVDVPEYAQMENNEFAVFDVDGDGIDELIYSNGDSTMAGMIATVYRYDQETGRLFQTLSGYVGMTFYDNGVVTIMSSHNQGLGQMEGFWPYALYCDPGNDSYTMAAYVDGWDGSFFPEDHEGNPFPSDIDQDGDKAVYILTYPGQEVTETILDGPAYQEWLDSYLAGAAKLDIPWQNMTPENIQAIAP